MGWIYKITSPDQRIYVGATTNIKERFKHYRLLLCKNQHRLYDSLKKWGVRSHKFEIITECGWMDMPAMELAYGTLYATTGKNGLNVCLPTNTRIKTILKKTQLGDLLLKDFNFNQNSEFKELTDNQKELLIYYIRKHNLLPREVMRISLENYFEKKFEKLHKHLLK